ncbi:DUF421 domain-containing protein [Microaerobacter geothermalis]|uniref:DUF421 domain-containing protein n=1 Tax=Microaerobacter geothermalis TaxID=674972 RepID=UPI001F1B2623|nr:DUF421 domain-containing protein [Microaerobacter geothermalis]MCF6094955.1 DUF421 domain-containing protein [Microaerobacter geothermalis]
MSFSLLVLIRSLFAFFFLFIMTKFIGKQQVSELTLFEYLVGITVGSIAADLAIGLELESITGIIGILVWTILPITLGFISLKSRFLRRVIESEPRILIRDGYIVEENLKKERMHIDQLMMALRLKNVFNLSDVQMAIMEVNGQISVMKKADKQPVTPHQLHLHVNPEEMPMTLIKEGKINNQRLLESGMDEAWLIGELAKKGITDISTVSVAQIDSTGSLFVDLKNSWEEYASPAHYSLMAKFDQIAADLNNFALDTQDTHMKKQYQHAAEEVTSLSKNLKSFLKQKR